MFAPSHWRRHRIDLNDWFDRGSKSVWLMQHEMLVDGRFGRDF
jgi:hypothetical protein